MKASFVLLLSLSFSRLVTAQIIVDTTATATRMVQRLTGPGVSTSHAVLTCSPLGSGTFDSAASVGLGIPDGVVLSTGRAMQVRGRTDVFASTMLHYPADSDLSATLSQAGSQFIHTNDACSLEFDIIPRGDTLSFRYVFGSEEYGCCVCSAFNDAFAFFITGPKPGGGSYSKYNMARIPGTNLPVSINTVNEGQPSGTRPASGCISLSYAQYYMHNNTPPSNRYLTYEGYTVPLDATAAVSPCQIYHLKMVVADVVDYVFDSGVFIEGGSIVSRGLPSIDSVMISYGAPYAMVGCADATVTVRSASVLPYPSAVHYTVTGSAVNGYDYAAIADSVIIPAGDSVGRITIHPLSHGTPSGMRFATIALSSGLCMSSAYYDSVTIPIADSLVMHVGPDASVCEGMEVSLSISGTPYVTWSPAEGLSDIHSSHPVAHPMSSMTYLASYSFGSCTDTGSVRITVIPADSAGCRDSIVGKHLLYIPNAFTPNGDGTNDIFLIYPVEASYIQLSIFDRWGEKIFETFDEGSGWDGTYRGHKVPDGVYVYTLLLAYGDGYAVHQRGSITLIR